LSAHVLEGGAVPRPVGVDALPPALRGSLNAVVRACGDAFGPHLRCVIVKGSAVKGDFLPGYSDLDVHAFVSPEVLMSDRAPKLEYAMRFQEAIGGLEPRDAGASQFQVYFLPTDRPPEDWAPAVPGSYEVVYGEPPAALVNWRDFDYQGRAKQALASIPGDVRTLIERTLDKPNRSLGACVRLAGTFVKGHAYSAAIVAAGDAGRALTMRTSELLQFLEDTDPSLAAVRRFFDFAAGWDRVEREPAYARDAYRAAIEALEAIQRWAASRIV